MAPRQKATTPARMRRTDVPKSEAVVEKPQPRPTSSNGSDTAGGHDLSNGHDIAALAYELFMQRGGEHGHDLEDWLAAERQLSSREG
jgi:Protein of unknown function (DUF2934)